jgi:hypothetical protein
VFITAGALAVGYAVYAVSRSADTVEQDKQAVVTEKALTEVSDPLAKLCADDPVIRARVGPACTTAAKVASSPEPAKALRGEPGADGRGITATLLDQNGRLVLTYSDGTTQDVGQVVGKAGEQGAQGQAGVGIVSSTVSGGHLVLTFTDGQVVDVGRIVGDPGRGVASTAIVDGHLIVSYDDGTTQDAGELPVAEPVQGTPPAELVVVRSDGVTVHCPRSGGTDTAPVYRCADGSGSAGE